MVASDAKRLFSVLALLVLIALAAILLYPAFRENREIYAVSALSTHEVRVGSQSAASFEQFCHLLNREIQIVVNNAVLSKKFRRIRFVLTEKTQPILTLKSTLGYEGDMLAAGFYANNATLDIHIYVAENALKHPNMDKVSYTIGWYLNGLAQLVKENEAQGFAINLHTQGASDQVDFMNAQEQLARQYAEYGGSALPFILKKKV